MSELDYSKLKFLLKKKNVVGFSTRLHNKIVNGREIPIKCIRIYVERKVPKEMLAESDIIPEELFGIKTDVVEIGKVEALSEFDPKAKHRPVTAGISIGNAAITAGTLGWYYYDEEGGKYFGSCAHVFCQDPFSDKQTEDRILQPGPADGGNADLDVVGVLFKYTKLNEGDNATNNLDFAVSSIQVECDWKMWSQYEPTQLVGHLFAGSEQVTVVFKGKYISDFGFKPLNASFVDVNVGDYVEKWGRSSGHKVGRVLDTSATVKVYYDQSRYAIFEDQILTENISAPGDSGSSVWKTTGPGQPGRPYPLKKGKWIIKGKLWFIPVELEFEEVEEDEI